MNLITGALLKEFPIGVHFFEDGIVPENDIIMYHIILKKIVTLDKESKLFTDRSFIKEDGPGATLAALFNKYHKKEFLYSIKEGSRTICYLSILLESIMYDIFVSFTTIDIDMIFIKLNSILKKSVDDIVSIVGKKIIAISSNQKTKIDLQKLFCDNMYYRFMSAANICNYLFAADSTDNSTAASAADSTSVSAADSTDNSTAASAADSTSVSTAVSASVSTAVSTDISTAVSAVISDADSTAASTAASTADSTAISAADSTSVSTADNNIIEIYIFLFNLLRKYGMSLVPFKYYIPWIFHFINHCYHLHCIDIIYNLISDNTEGAQCTFCLTYNILIFIIEDKSGSDYKIIFNFLITEFIISKLHHFAIKIYQNRVQQYANLIINSIQNNTIIFCELINLLNSCKENFITEVILLIFTNLSNFLIILVEHVPIVESNQDNILLIFKICVEHTIGKYYSKEERQPESICNSNDSATGIGKHTGKSTNKCIQMPKNIDKIISLYNTFINISNKNNTFYQQLVLFLKIDIFMFDVIPLKTDDTMYIDKQDVLIFINNIVKNGINTAIMNHTLAKILGIESEYLSQCHNNDIEEAAKEFANNLIKEEEDKKKKEAAKKPAKKPTKKPAKKPAEEAARGEVEEVAKKTAEEVAKKTTEEVAKKTAEEVAREEAAKKTAKKKDIKRAIEAAKKAEKKAAKKAAIIIQTNIRVFFIHKKQKSAATCIQVAYRLYTKKCNSAKSVVRTVEEYISSQLKEFSVCNALGDTRIYTIGSAAYGLNYNDIDIICILGNKWNRDKFLSDFYAFIETSSRLILGGRIAESTHPIIKLMYRADNGQNINIDLAFLVLSGIENITPEVINSLITTNNDYGALSTISVNAIRNTHELKLQIAQLGELGSRCFISVMNAVRGMAIRSLISSSMDGYLRNISLMVMVMNVFNDSPKDSTVGLILERFFNHYSKICNWMEPITCSSLIKSSNIVYELVNNLDIEYNLKDAYLITDNGEYYGNGCYYFQYIPGLRYTAFVPVGYTRLMVAEGGGINYITNCKIQLPAIGYSMDTAIYNNPKVSNMLTAFENAARIVYTGDDEKYLESLNLIGMKFPKGCYTIQIKLTLDNIQFTELVKSYLSYILPQITSRLVIHSSCIFSSSYIHIDENCIVGYIFSNTLNSFFRGIIADIIHTRTLPKDAGLVKYNVDIFYY